MEMLTVIKSECGTAYVDLSGKFEIQQRFSLEPSDVDYLKELKKNLDNPDYSSISETRTLRYHNHKLAIKIEPNDDLSFSKLCVKKPTLGNFIDSIIAN